MLGRGPFRFLAGFSVYSFGADQIIVSATMPCIRFCYPFIWRNITGRVTGPLAIFPPLEDVFDVSSIRIAGLGLRSDLVV